MAAAQTIPAAASEPMHPPVPAAGASAQQALAPAAPSPANENQDLWHGQALRLPVELDVTVPVPQFRVRHLLALEPGKVIESRWNYGNDVPLASGAVQLAWSEFEVIEKQLAVRITRLP